MRAVPRCLLAKSTPKRHLPHNKGGVRVVEFILVTGCCDKARVERFIVYLEQGDARRREEDTVHGWKEKRHRGGAQSSGSKHVDIVRKMLTEQKRAMHMYRSIGLPPVGAPGTISLVDPIGRVVNPLSVFSRASCGNAHGNRICGE